jgi:hypothetical protein
VIEENNEKPPQAQDIISVIADEKKNQPDDNIEMILETTSGYAYSTYFGIKL